jgi:hypothetical protein
MTTYIVADWPHKNDKLYQNYAKWTSFLVLLILGAIKKSRFLRFTLRKIAGVACWLESVGPNERCCGQRPRGLFCTLGQTMYPRRRTQPQCYLFNTACLPPSSAVQTLAITTALGDFDFLYTKPPVERNINLLFPLKFSSPHQQVNKWHKICVLWSSF